MTTPDEFQELSFLSTYSPQPNSAIALPVSPLASNYGLDSHLTVPSSISSQDLAPLSYTDLTPSVALPTSQNDLVSDTYTTYNRNETFHQFPINDKEYFFSTTHSSQYNSSYIPQRILNISNFNDPHNASHVNEMTQEYFISNTNAHSINDGSFPHISNSFNDDGQEFSSADDDVAPHLNRDLASDMGRGIDTTINSNCSPCSEESGSLSDTYINQSQSIYDTPWNEPDVNYQQSTSRDYYAQQSPSSTTTTRSSVKESDYDTSATFLSSQIDSPMFVPKTSAMKGSQRKLTTTNDIKQSRPQKRKKSFSKSGGKSSKKSKNADDDEDVETNRSDLLRTLPPCRICKEKASGFHYGVNTCEACKGFFRRALKQGSNFECKFKKQCDVTGPCRTLCSYCRYQKCLEVGMSKKAIKVGRYTHETRTRNIIEVKILKEQQKQLNLTGGPPTDECNDSDKNFKKQQKQLDEERRMKIKIQQQHYKLHKLHQQKQAKLRRRSSLSKKSVMCSQQDPTSSTNSSFDSKGFAKTNTETFPRKLLSLPSSEKDSSLVPSTSVSLSVIPGCSSRGMIEPAHESGSSHSDDETETLISQVNSAEETTRLYNGGQLLVEHLSLLYQFQKRNAVLNHIPRPMSGSTKDGMDSVISSLMDAHNRLILVSTYFPDRFISEKLRTHLRHYKLKQQVFGDMPTISDDEYIDIYKSTGIDVDGRINLIKVHIGYFEAYVRKLIKFAKAIPGFKSLPVDDQSNLLKSGRTEFWIFGAYRGYDMKMETAIMPNGRCFHMSDLYRMFSPVWVEACFETAECLKRSNLLPEELVVLKTLALTMQDRCPISDRSTVERIQNFLLACLDYLMMKYHPNEDHSVLLGKTLHKLTEVRPVAEMDEFNTRRKILMEYYNRRPLLREIFEGSNSSSNVSALPALPDIASTSSDSSD